MVELFGLRSRIRNYQVEEYWANYGTFSSIAAALNASTEMYALSHRIKDANGITYDVDFIDDPEDEDMCIPSIGKVVAV